MAEIDLTTLYNELRDSIKRVVDKDKDIPRDFGYLGYELIPGQGTSVLSYTNPNNYLVRMKDNTFKEIPHRGNCSPVPNLPVEIRYINNNKEFDRVGYIYGVNEEEASTLTNITPSALNSVGPHSHHRGSGMEFPIDMRMIFQLQAKYGASMVIIIQPGFYYTVDGLKYFPGSSIDLNSNRPTATSYKRWVIVSIDPDDNTLTATNGTAVPSISSLTESGLESIGIPEGHVPVLGAKLYQNRNRITEFDLVALHNIANNNTGTPAEHTHDAADIVSGILNILRIPDITLSKVTDAGALAALDTVGTTQIDDDAVTLGKLAHGTAGKVIGFDGSGIPSEITLPTGGITQLSGDVTAGPGSGSQVATIANGAVTAAKIATNTITANEIAANAIGSSELADNAVDTNAIQDDAVTSAKIAANAVGSSELADNAVDTAAIQDDAVTSAKIVNSAITRTKLAEVATPMVCDYRLSCGNVTDTLTEAVGDIIYLAKWRGDRITIHDGSRWYLLTPTSEPSFDGSPTQAMTVSYTNGSNIVTTSVAPNQNIFPVGMRVTSIAAGFASTPFITAWTSATTFTVNINATSTNSAAALTCAFQETKNYDFFAYMTGTSEDVELTCRAWTNNTTRAISLAETNGRWHISGSPQYLYVGSAHNQAGGNDIYDNNGLRFLWSYFNPQRRILRAVSVANTFNDTDTNIHQYNSSSNNQVRVMIGLPNLSHADLMVYAYGTIAGQRAGIGYDSTTAFDTVSNLGQRSAADAFTTKWERLLPDIGMHTLSFNAAGAASGTWVGINNNFSAGIAGGIWM